MKTIRKSKLKDKVRSSIQEAILSGEIKYGDRIVETKLAASMGVSQSPVREALKELELMGLIENKPYYGSYVKPFTEKWIDDAYDARIILELYCVSKTAESIDAKNLKKLHSYIEKMEEAAYLKEVDTLVDYDIAFHEYIIKCSGNDTILRLWRMANLALWTYITTRVGGKSLAYRAERHYLIYDAISAKDAGKAQELMETHLNEPREEMKLWIASHKICEIG